MIETKELSFMESGMKAGINDLHQLYDEGWLTLETLKLRLGRYYIKLYKETQGKKKTYEFKKGEIVKYGDVMPVVSMTENDWWKYEGHMIRILKDIKFTVTIEMEDK